MHWKKTISIIVLLIVVLIAAISTFLIFYDFNQLKPTISKLVKEATGRELAIEGDIYLRFGLPPIIAVTDVSFQNAPWGSQPQLAQIKQIEIQIALLPLIRGNFVFTRVTLVEPEFILELDPSGTTNITFETDKTEKKKETALPNLIFSDVQISKGRFSYRDAGSELSLVVQVDRLDMVIPGFDKPMQLHFEGVFDELPWTLKGTIGPIRALIEPGYSLWTDLTAAVGQAKIHVAGEIQDLVNLKGMAFNVMAEGPSLAEIAKLAGVTAIPELGTFKLSTRVTDPGGRLAVENLEVQIGSEAVAAISLTGAVSDILAFQGLNLHFILQGHDVANLTQLGLPPPPMRGAFKVSGGITAPAPKVFALKDLNAVLWENEINGQVHLNLADLVPIFRANLTSQQSKLGPFNLDLEITATDNKLAMQRLDLQLGTEELVKLQLKGAIGDLIEMHKVDLIFQLQSRNLANLEQVSGRPLPLRGAFNATGKVLIPVPKNLEIPELKITVGRNHISGELNLDLRGDQPQLNMKLSLPHLDLSSVLAPEMAKQSWVKGLSRIRPIRLAAKLAGFARELAVQKLDLQAGKYDTAELRLMGSVENLPARRGITLNFNLRGKDLTKLKEISGQPYFFTPLPGQGSYAISGKIRSQTDQNYRVDDFNLQLAENKLTGRLRFNLATQPLRYEVELSAPRFNLKPFPIPKGAVYSQLNKIDNLGPLKLHSKLTLKNNHLSLQHLDLQAGTPQLAAVAVKGAIKNLTAQRGIDFNFKFYGREIAALEKITDRSLALKGAFAVSGRLTDPSLKNYKFNNLMLKLGKNNIAGGLDIKLSGKQFNLSADLSSPEFTLQPVDLPAIVTLTRVEDLGPFKLTLNLVGSEKKISMQNLNLLLGNRNLIEVLLKGSIANLQGPERLNLEFAVRGNDVANIKKLGGPNFDFKGAFNASAQFSEPSPKVYKLSSMQAVWGDNSGNGWAELDLSKKRPQLKAELTTEKLDLRPFMVPKKSLETTNSRSSKPTKKDKNKVFTSEPLQLEGLKKFDADIKLRDKQVLLPAVALNDVGVDILLKNGHLRVQPFKFKIGRGTADVKFALQSQNKPAVLETTLQIDQLEIGPMLEQLGYQRSVEGNLDIFVDLKSAGNSIAALMANLNGGIIIALSDGKAASKYNHLLENYFGSGILQLLNPFKRKREYATLNCVVNHVEIIDGLADIRLLLDTRQTSIFAAGDINLKTEALNLGLKPTPKKIGNAPVGVRFSFRELSKPFRLGGTLAKPRLVIDSSRTAFVVGKMAGALALGPIGVTAFFADVSVGKKDACAVALKAAEERQPAAKPKKRRRK